MICPRYACSHGGETINPEAWMWYYNTVGQARCPIVDTWWQTETGCHMIARCPVQCQSNRVPAPCRCPGYGAIVKRSR